MSLSSWLEKWMGLEKRRLDILTMNRRNLGYIYPGNPRSGFPVADNKLLTKQILSKIDVPLPETHFVYDSFFSLRSMKSDLNKLADFVVKPAQGSAGGGILVIVKRDEHSWITAGGHPFDEKAMKNHISDIIFGIHSFGMSDQAMVESRVIQHAEINEIYPSGLADLRVILHESEPVMAMLRIPTHESDGKANLHQGAIGAGVDMDTGKIIHAVHAGESITHHIDSDFPLLGFPVSDWSAAIEVAIKVSRAVPLQYLGVDIALSENGPVILEINVRPGIEIQNANLRGLEAILKAKRNKKHG